jgi:surface-anchored protein
MMCMRAFCRAVLLASLPAASVGTALATPAYYLSGHGDMGVVFHAEGAGALELHYHLIGTGSNLPTDPQLYSNGVVALGNYIGYEPGHPGAWPADGIRTVVPLAAQRSNPSSDIQATLGISGTSSYWRLPNSNEAGVPYFGIATEELAEDTGAAWSNITFTLKTVEGPGNVSVWKVLPEGGLDVLWQSYQGISTSDVFTLTNDEHAHYVWAFSEPGIYMLGIEAAGSRTFDSTTTQFTTGTEVFTFQVVPEPGSLMLAGIGCLGAAGFTWLRKRTNRRIGG